MRSTWSCIRLGGIFGLCLSAAIVILRTDPSVHTTAAAVDATLASASVASNSGPLYDIPRLDQINIDGKPDDWGDRGFRVDVMASTAQRVQSQADIDGMFRIGWDDRGLLILLKVFDDVPTESVHSKLTDGDSVEMYISPRVGSPAVVQALIAPGIDPANPKVRTVVRGPTTDTGRKIKPTITVARTVLHGGYEMEVLIPWEDLQVKPTSGMELGFQMIINDQDGEQQGAHLLWYPCLGTLKDRSKMHRLRLAAAPSAPVRAAASGDYVHFHKTRVNVMATGDLAGKSVEVRHGNQIMIHGTLEQDFVQPDRSSAALSMPMPPRDKPYGTLDVLVDGKPIAALDLPAPVDAARWLLPYQEFIFKPCVFATHALPEGDFVEASYVEDMIGEYEIRTRFYDADYNLVVKADKPGRYGAVVEIRTADGKTYKRYRTLFREPKDISWRNANMPFTVKLPKEFGISSDALKEQSHAVSEYFKRMLSEGVNNEADTAVLLAGLYETKPGVPVTGRMSPVSLDHKWWAGLRKKLGDTKQDYLVYLPPGYEEHRKTKWPVILALHGKGESGTDLNQLKESGLPARLEYHRADFPFVVIAPQMSYGETWNPWMLDILLDEVLAKYKVDADRVYLTGMSMGGYGTWATATEFPERFAAIAPICGGGDQNETDRIKDLPIWVFHGSRDGVVPFTESEHMVDALRVRGSDVIFTIVPDTGHDCWTAAYATEELYSWFLAHRRAHPTASATAQKVNPQ